MNVKARLQKLERRSQVSREPFRVVVSHAGKPFDLATATCTRTLMQDGGLLEIVNVNGSGNDLSDEELEEFIQSHPIEGPPLTRSLARRLERLEEQVIPEDERKVWEMIR